jgi:proline iminopeptidase
LKYILVVWVNLRESGNSDKAKDEDELSMVESVRDLEAIRDKLGYSKWIFAGHSTGGMLGLVYGIHFAQSLNGLIVGGAAASKEYMNILSKT